VISEVCEVLVTLVSVRSLGQGRKSSINHSPEAVVVVDKLPFWVVLSQVDMFVKLVGLVGTLQIEFKLLRALVKEN
jgi:hypothetical protein